MNTHADKTQENTESENRRKNQSAANALSQDRSGGESTFYFVDNRPEAIQMRKLQELANSSARNGPFQFVDNRPEAVAQRKLQEFEDNCPVLNILTHHSRVLQRVIGAGMLDELKRLARKDGRAKVTWIIKGNKPDIVYLSISSSGSGVIYFFSLKDKEGEQSEGVFMERNLARLSSVDSVLQEAVQIGALSELSSPRPEIKGTTNMDEETANTGAGVLEKGKVNIIGEDHDDMKKYRDAERLEVEQQEFGYMQEEELTTSEGVKADPPFLKFLQALDAILNPEDPPSMFMGRKATYAESAIRYLREAQNEFDVYGSVRGDGSKKMEGIETVELPLLHELIGRCNAKKSDEVQETEEKLRSIFPGLLRGEISGLRSQHMLQAAFRVNSSIVWKVGQFHIVDMKRNITKEQRVKIKLISKTDWIFPPKAKCPLGLYSSFV